MTSHQTDLNPYLSPTTTPGSPVSPPGLRESDYLKAWAAYFVCALFGSGVAGALLGGILGFIMGSSGSSLDSIRLVCGLGGFVAGLPVSYLFFRLFVSRMLVQKITG
jgi:hypothetical protein